MGKNVQINLSQQEAIWLANYILGSYSKAQAGEDGAAFFQQLLNQCMDVQRPRHSKQSPIGRPVAGVAFVQDVQIKTGDGASIKVTVDADLNALAIFSMVPEMVEFIRAVEARMRAFKAFGPSLSDVDEMQRAARGILITIYGGAE